MPARSHLLPRSLVLWTLATLALTPFACGKAPPAPVAPPPVATAPVAAPSPAPVTAPLPAPVSPPDPVTEASAAPEAAPIPEAEVRAVLDAWLKAQNDGLFEDYAALYAERFFGTKRSGARTRSFQRDAWLRDRKRMFSKTMKVTAESVQLQTSAESAVVGFTQSWASGTYKDVGPKQLVIVRTPEGLRIAREEMLASMVDNGEVQPVALSRQDFAFVVHEKDEAHVVLHLRPEASWSKGKLELLSGDGHASVRQPAVLEALPEELRMWPGREVSLYGAEGQTCRGKISGLYVLSRVQPHFGTVAYWKGEETGKPLASWRVAREAWGLAAGGRLLVAKVDPLPRMRCRGAFWARGSNRLPPVLAPSGPVPPLVAREALSRFRKLRGYAEVQKAYLTETREPRAGLWDAFEGAAPSVTVLNNAEGAPAFVAVGARAGDGCGEFIGAFWALWRVRLDPTPDKPPRLQLLSDERDPGRFFELRAGVDLDGDGQFEFISVDGLLQSAGPVWRESEAVEVPSLDCPC